MSDIAILTGSQVKIDFAFKQAEDYPVDLYYLLDLSQSMKNDLESLRSLGQQLGESMQSITRDFKLGFGSFVDKTVMPYISTVKSKLVPTVLIKMFVQIILMFFFQLYQRFPTFSICTPLKHFYLQVPRVFPN